MANKRDNSGTFSKNRNKDKDSHPDIKGQCTINGVDYWLDGWLKEGQNGKFYSVSFKEKEQQNRENRERLHEATKSFHAPAQQPDDFDSIPF